MSNFNRFFAPKGKIRGRKMDEGLLPRKDLSLGAKLLYSVLASCAGEEMVYCYPSQKYLADTMGVSVRSVQNYLRELEEKQLIETKRDRFGGSCKYFFLHRSDLISSSATLTVTTASTVNARKTATSTGLFSEDDALFADTQNMSLNSARAAYKYNFNNINKYNTPPLPPVRRRPEIAPCSGTDGGGGIFSSGLERDFWKLFNAYPRKENPAAALRVWMQYQMQGAMPPLETLTAAVEANKRDNPAWLKEGGRYVPYLVNWLRDCRWNDEFSRPAQEGTAQTQGGVYEIAESGWCYLNKSESRREDAQPGSAKATPEEKDSDFEAVWAACPFDPGAKVVSYGFWKAMKQQQPEMDMNFILQAVSAASSDYDRKLWGFLKERVHDVAEHGIM